MSKQVYDFAIKKMPKQGRSQATFNAVIEACARLLAQSGYQNLTTNHAQEQPNYNWGTKSKIIQRSADFSHDFFFAFILDLIIG